VKPVKNLTGYHVLTGSGNLKAVNDRQISFVYLCL